MSDERRIDDYKVELMHQVLRNIFGMLIVVENELWTFCLPLSIELCASYYTVLKQTRNCARTSKTRDFDLSSLSLIEKKMEGVERQATRCAPLSSATMAAIVAAEYLVCG